MTVPHPAKGPPERCVIEGRYTRLEPLAPGHTADLFAAAVPERFAWLFEHAPSDEAGMAQWVAQKAAGADPMFWAVIDRATGRAEGRQALMRIVPEHGVIEVGSVYWGPAIARTRVATEALYLFAQYIFDDLGYRRFEWKCHALNEPSRRAALRFGFAFEGIFRQHMILKGENRDTAWFAMLDGDWPRLRAEYERWLAPENFGADGVQRTPLRFG
jgi:RimJ/RimL family protein N-acetyltransferase